MEFAERLRHLRERTGLNQNAFAREADVPQPVVSRLELGIRGVEGLTVGVAQKLARTLGVSVDHLIGMYEDGRDTHRPRSSRRKKPREPALPEGAAPHRPQQRRQIRERLRQQLDERQQQLAEWQQRQLAEEQQRQLAEWQQQLAEEQQQLAERRTAPHQMQLPLGRGVSPGLTAQAIVKAMGGEYAVRLAHELTARAQAAPAHQYAAPAGAEQVEDSEF
jgi:transcriptional regulator with XRE-family HTH domain